MLLSEGSEQVQGHIDEIVDCDIDRKCEKSESAIVAVAKAEVAILLDTAVRAALPINSMDDGPFSSTLEHVNWLNMKNESISVQCEDVAIINVSQYCVSVINMLYINVSVEDPSLYLHRQDL